MRQDLCIYHKTALKITKKKSAIDSQANIILHSFSVFWEIDVLALNKLSLYRA